MKQVSSNMIFILKIIIHIIFLITFGILFFSVEEGVVGDPVQEIMFFTGKTALNTFFISLLISPLANLTKQMKLMQLRRLIGLYGFFWATMHLLAYIFLSLGGDLSLFLFEIKDRPYLTLGIFTWIILLLLSITSFAMIRIKMGDKWQKLHNWIYLAVILAPIHYYWSVKSEILIPTLYCIFAIGLLALRLKKFTWFNKLTHKIKK